MNKTLSIGLAGFSFVIEEHAYIKLSEYLAALRNSLDTSEAEEVMHDIEIRMVEIFKDSLGKREVINNEDVEKVIAQIGKPEQIEEQEEAYFSENTKNRKNNGAFSEKRQLFRDPSRAKIAGVLSGLSYYLGIDVTLLRLIPVGIILLDIFTTWGISSFFIFLLYIVLWIVLPKAETASDFLKMKGKPVNFDTLKEESNKIVQFANDSTQKVGEIYNENKPYFNKAGSGLWEVIRYILGGIFGFISILFILSAVFVFGILGMGGDYPWSGEMNFLFEDNGMNYLLAALCSTASLIPAFLFGLLAIKLISPKTKVRNVGYVLGGLFILTLILSMIFGLQMAKKDMIHKGHKEDTENVAINTTSDSLFVDVKQILIPQNFTAYDDDLFSNKQDVYEEDYPYVNVERRPDVKTPYLVIKKEGKGYNIPVQMNVQVEIRDNKILLPNFVKYPYKDRFRDYNVTYDLIVPQNTKVFKVKENGLQLEGDLNGDGKNDNDYDDDSQGSVKMSANGNTIIYNSNLKDSVIVNGKKVPKEVAENIMDSVNINNLKDVDIQIKNGKKEISIKTK